LIGGLEMKNLKFKLIVSLGIIIAAMLIAGISVYAANESTEIVQQTNGDYMIYINNNEGTNFSFAFSDSSSAAETSLTYYTAGTDAKGNKVAYINTTILNNNPAIKTAVTAKPPVTIYMWAKVLNSQGTYDYIEEAAPVNVGSAIQEEDVKAAGAVTNTIPVNINQTGPSTSDVNGVPTTVQTGTIELTDTSAQYEYQIVKLPSTDEYNNLFSLAATISKYLNSTNVSMIEKIDTYNTFNSLYNSLQPSAADSNWLPVTNYQILQPADTKNGDQYIVWIKNTTTGEIDAQFMTSTQIPNQTWTREVISALPITGADYTLEIIFGILLVAAAGVYIVIRRLESKNRK